MVSSTRHVKKSRKWSRCDWCWESIEVGQPKDTWFCFDEAVEVRMHPECRVACGKANIEYELPLPATYRRGCHCGESAEHCECKTEQC